MLVECNFGFTYVVLVLEMQKKLKITAARSRKTMSNSKDVRPSNSEKTLWSFPQFDGKFYHAMLISVTFLDWTLVDQKD